MRHLSHSFKAYPLRSQYKSASCVQRGMLQTEAWILEAVPRLRPRHSVTDREDPFSLTDAGHSPSGGSAVQLAAPRQLVPVKMFKKKRRASWWLFAHHPNLLPSIAPKGTMSGSLPNLPYIVYFWKLAMFLFSPSKPSRWLTSQSKQPKSKNLVISARKSAARKSNYPLKALPI